MPDNSMHSYDLRYRNLWSPRVSWQAVAEIVEYFIIHEAERRQVGNSRIAGALLDLALHQDSLINGKAVWGLVQLERWEELGQLACIWIDPNKELKHHFTLHGDHYKVSCLFDPDAIRPLGWALKSNLQKPVNTDALWPAVRKFFRREDETVLQRAIYVIEELHIAPAYLTLKRLIENPEKSALHSYAAARRCHRCRSVLPRISTGTPQPGEVPAP